MASKGSEFSLTPDLNDGFVYMDEFVNYLVEIIICAIAILAVVIFAFIIIFRKNRATP